jgi:membrane-bound ClpP family serine protease
LVLLSLALNVFSFVEGIGTLQGMLIGLGMLLLLAEAFIPGFGVAGISGLVMVTIGIILTARTAFEAVMMVLILLLFLALVLWIILRSAKKGKLAKKLILWSAAKHEDGFRTSADNSAFVGREGVALTVLRPAGSGDFSGERLDVVTDGTFIESGTKIKIVRTEGRRIVVKAIE